MRTGEEDVAAAHHSAAASVNAQKKLFWAKVLTAKSLAQNSNVTMRMPKMEELKNGMELLKEMRGVIGELVYAAEVKNLWKSFPVFKSFEKSVTKIDIIDLLDDDDDDEEEDHDVHNRNSKPRASKRHCPPDNASDISCTEEDISSKTVYGRSFPPKRSPFEDKDDGDGDNNVTSHAAGVGDAQEELSENLTL